MNRSLEVLKEVYKPIRYTYKGKSLILETTSGNIVVKAKKKDLKNLFSYLKSRNFNNYPEILEETRKDVSVFSYIEDIDVTKEERAIDLIDTLALLHSKTTFYKEVTQDTYKDIYDNIKLHINTKKKQFETLYEEYIYEVYPSPSMYLFLRNYSKIMDCLAFVESELEEWLSLVLEEKTQRVCQIHGKPCLEHFLESENGLYFVSWEDARCDTPILDLRYFYEKDYLKVDFSFLLERYLKKYDLHPSERKLLFLTISLPIELSLEQAENELTKTKHLKDFCDYIYKTEDLIRPYYAVEKEDK